MAEGAIRIKIMPAKKTSHLPWLILLLMILLGSSCGGNLQARLDRAVQETSAAIIATHTGDHAPSLLPTPAPFLLFSEPTQIATEAVEPEPAENLESQESLRVFLGIEPISIDPAFATGLGLQVASEMFPGLTRIDEETLDVLPGMAETWTTTDDRLTWTFTLQGDIPWVWYNPESTQIEPLLDAEGEVLFVTADDFARGMLRVLEQDNHSPYAQDLFIVQHAGDFFWKTENLSGEIGIHVLDSTTLQLQLDRPSAYLNMLADMPFMAAWPPPEAVTDEMRALGGYPSAGYGPYILKEWKPASHITLTRNPFWPVMIDSIPLPYYKDIHLIFMDETSALLAFSQRNLEVAIVEKEYLSTVVEYEQMRNSLTLYPGDCTTYYAFDTSQPPFDSPAVRQAFSYAINREQLVSQVVPGQNEVSSGFLLSWLYATPQGIIYPDLHLTYEPELAKKLLAEAYPDLLEMPLVRLQVANDSSSMDVAVHVIAMWQETLGVTVTLRSLPLEYHLESLRSELLPQVWGMDFCPMIPHSANMLEAWRNSPQTLAAGWENPQFDRAILNIHNTQDILAQYDQTAIAEYVLLHQDAVIAPLYSTRRAVLTAPGISRTFSLLQVERFEKWKSLEP